MNTVYDLRKDALAIEAMQRASRDSGPVGLKITHGLVGADDWWSNVESGELPVHFVKGVVSGFWPGQWGDGPAEFELQTEHGERVKSLCEMQPTQARTEFRLGRRVELCYVLQALKAPLEGASAETKVIVSISLE
jgi:hypothetical protein